MYETYRDYEFGKDDNVIVGENSLNACSFHEVKEISKTKEKSIIPAFSGSNVVEMTHVPTESINEILPKVEGIDIVRNTIIIRGLWGDSEHGPQKDAIKSMKKLKSIENQKQTDHVVYVFGEENYNILKGDGFKCILVSGDPMPFEDDARMQIEVLRQAFLQYPECNVLYVGWDIYLDSEIGEDFWETANLQHKFHIQAPLRMYKRKQCKWRDEDQRKVPSTNLLYVKGKEVPDQLIDVWQREKPSILDRIVMKYIDETVGEWKGADFYREHFELDGFVSKWTKELFPDIKKNIFFKEINDIETNKGSDYDRPKVAPEFSHLIKKDVPEIPLKEEVIPDKTPEVIPEKSVDLRTHDDEPFYNEKAIRTPLKNVSHNHLEFTSTIKRKNN